MDEWTLRSWARAGFLCAAASLVTVAAWATPGGIVTKSGKQGSSCPSCHTGGKRPGVALDGPASLDAGSIATYTFRITSDSGVVAGFNAAISEEDGVMYGDDGGTSQEEQNEVTHLMPNAFDAGEFVYTFSLKAPPYGGKLTVYAAGQACDNDGTTDGDQAAQTTFDISVNGPPRPPPPEAGPPPTPPPPATATPTVDASTSSRGDAGTSAAAPKEEDSGCSIGWADRTSAPAGATLAALFGLAALTRKRRRR